MIFWHSSNLTNDMRQLVDNNVAFTITSEHALLQSGKPDHIWRSEHSQLFLWGSIYRGPSKAVLNDKFSYICKLIQQGCKGSDVVSIALLEFRDLVEGRFWGAFFSEEEWWFFGDRFQTLDLFWSQTKTGIAVAHTLELLTKVTKVSGYNAVSLMNMFAVYGNYTPKKHTIYSNIRRVGIDEVLHVKQMQAKQFQREFQPVSIENYELDAQDSYAERFEQAVVDRASSGTNWVYFSSGWDSTAITACLVKHFGKNKVRGVIGAMTYSKRAGLINKFELDRAGKFAEYFGISLDVVEWDMTTDDMLHAGQRLMPNFRSHHVYNVNLVNFSTLAEVVNKHALVGDSIFSGEISDGLHNFGFSQYATILDHPDLGFREYADKMMNYLYSPSFFERFRRGEAENDSVYRFMKNKLSPDLFIDQSGLSEEERTRNFLESLFISSNRFPGTHVNFSKLIKDVAVEQFRDEMFREYLGSATRNLNSQHFYSYLLHLYNSFHWQGSSVKSLTASLEPYQYILSMPFWDSELVSFCERMPESWGRGLELRPTKYPLKWYLENKVDYPMHLQRGPHSYLYDVDSGFSHSEEWFFHSAFTSWYRELLREGKYRELLDSDFYDLDYIDKLVNKYICNEYVSGSEQRDLENLLALVQVGWY